MLFDNGRDTPTGSIEHIPVPVQGAKRVTGQRPPKYDDMTTWKSYLAKFEIAAGLNAWSTSEKATFLATSPEGNATNDLDAIHTGRPTARLCSFDNRFGNECGSAVQKELNRVKLRNHTPNVRAVDAVPHGAVCC